MPPSCKAVHTAACKDALQCLAHGCAAHAVALQRFMSPMLQSHCHYVCATAALHVSTSVKLACRHAPAVTAPAVHHQMSAPLGTGTAPCVCTTLWSAGSLAAGHARACCMSLAWPSTAWRTQLTALGCRCPFGRSGSFVRVHLGHWQETSVATKSLAPVLARHMPRPDQLASIVGTLGSQAGPCDLKAACKPNGGPAGHAWQPQGC